jgi:hypothetical protein
MKKLMISPVLLFLILAVTAICPDRTAAQEEVSITIAPKQFVLDHMGTKVTVHTDIPYGEAVNETIEMHNTDGASIEPIGFKSDDRGYLVVKFSARDLAMIAFPPSAKLTMTGDFTAGGSFTGTDVIRVK